MHYPQTCIGRPAAISCGRCAYRLCDFAVSFKCSYNRTSISRYDGLICTSGSYFRSCVLTIVPAPATNQNARFLFVSALRFRLNANAMRTSGSHLGRLSIPRNSGRGLTAELRASSAAWVCCWLVCRSHPPRRTPEYL